MAMNDRWGQDRWFQGRWGGEDMSQHDFRNESRTSFAIPVGNSHYHTFMMDRRDERYPRSEQSSEREENPMRGRWS